LTRDVELFDERCLTRDVEFRPLNSTSLVKHIFLPGLSLCQLLRHNGMM